MEAIRKKMQLSSAFLFARITSVVVDRKPEKSEMQTAPYCFSLHFPQGRVGDTQQLPLVIRMTSCCLGWDGAVFFLSDQIIAVSRPPLDTGGTEANTDIECLRHSDTE